LKHDFYTAADFMDADPDSWGVRNIVEGGLAVCKVCGGGEGSLTTDCPGEKIPYEKDQRVYAGKIDYREGQGWVPEKNPTNQAWEYGDSIARVNSRRKYIHACYGTYGQESCVKPKCVSSCMADCRRDTKIVESYEARKGVPK